MDNKSKSQNLLILNNIRSCYNVGACIRICDSLNTGVIFQGITPYPIIKNDTRLPYIASKTHLKISKSATESINNVYFNYFATTTEAIEYVKNNNITLYTLETGVKNSYNIFDTNKLRVIRPFALVIGNEKQGVESEYLEFSKACFYIPMLGKNKSLNVSTAAAVALYHLVFNS